MAIACAAGTLGCPANPPRNPPADVTAVDDLAAVRDDGLTDAAASEGGSVDVAPDLAPTDAGAPADAPWVLRGDFVSAAVQGSGGGYTLTGVIQWSAAVEGSGGGYTLRGTLW